MASRDLHDLDPRLQPLCNQFLEQCAYTLPKGVKVGVDCTYRSGEEQDADYAKGRTAPGSKVTNAQAGQSAHNCTLPDGTPAARAFDIYIETGDGKLDWKADDQLWQRAIKIGEGLGLVSGAHWNCGLKDSPHFELPNWKASQ